MSNPSLWSSALVIVLLFALFLRKFRPQTFITKLPGPPSSSWLVGNIPEFARVENVGDSEFKWVEKYGTIFKYKGTFGADVLHVTDPKAVQHVLSFAGYTFQKPKADIALFRLFSGKGIIAVEEADHSRHRKIMNPAFAYTSLKGFLPIFSRLARKTSTKWRDIVAGTGNESTVIDVSEWLPRLTLDVIGEAALNYKFGALDNEHNELTKVYRNLFVDTLYFACDADIIFRALWGYPPLWIFKILRFAPLSGMKRIRNYVNVAFRVAKRLVDQEVAAIADGKPPRKDALSLLVRANAGENPKGKLSDHELLAEMSTLMIAGHETTSSTISWFLYELSRRPEYQHKIRGETIAARDRAAARGDESLTVADLESMTHTVAAMKETLRLHSIATFVSRSAECDDEIPLSKPHHTARGEMYTSIPVSKGQRVRISVASYNRLQSVWGDYAHEWRPERFIDGNLTENKISVGVYANLASFGSGLHGCIGWRFAVLEIQSVIIELLENFAFAPAPGNLEIIRAPTVVMTPMVRGQTDRGAQLPLQVTPL